jgi:hypothetical protein
MVALVVAIIAFYVAFFLYENVWQNRIDNLWCSVYDRAKVTRSTSTALFNRIGEILQNFFSQLFGRRLVSFQAIAVSLNLV